MRMMRLEATTLRKARLSKGEGLLMKPKVRKTLWDVFPLVELCLKQHRCLLELDSCSVFLDCVKVTARFVDSTEHNNATYTIPKKFPSNYGALSTPNTYARPVEVGERTQCC